MALLSNLIAEIVTIAKTASIDRVFDSAGTSINEPGIILVVELVNEYPYLTIDGVSATFIFKLNVLNALKNQAQAKKNIYDIPAELNVAFRDNHPTNADYWIIAPDERTEFGTTLRNQTQYYGFSKTLKVIGNFNV